MRKKRGLSAVLLGVILCFVVSGVGHGEVNHKAYQYNASFMKVELLDARVTYMMNNPANYLMVRFYYDRDGDAGEIFELPWHIGTKGKILVWIHDVRSSFSGKSGPDLLATFEEALEATYSFVNHLATDMDADIVALLESAKEIRLAYFYQGEYHLWEE